MILLVFMVAMMFFSSRGRKKQEEQIRQMHAQIEPGVWVRTTAGFYGIVSDVDGDVYILQSPSGEESYWDRRAIAVVTDPPFENDEDASLEEDVQELTDPVDAETVEASETEAQPTTDDVVPTDEPTEGGTTAEPAADEAVEEDSEDLWDDSFTGTQKNSAEDPKN
ncbi:MAG: preprotein translocase subunit YajC [Actinomycetaceae bacterium]|nr:preprotein translocase subunit YajC [Actinomycetaceae bacterium]